MEDKVLALFRELVGERASRLEPTHPARELRNRISAALVAEGDYSCTEEVIGREGIGFHLADWAPDAAFIVALALFPERFSDEEVRAGVDRFLVHVPAHIVEAARLGGYPVQNIFVDDEESAG